MHGERVDYFSLSFTRGMADPNVPSPKRFATAVQERPAGTFGLFAGMGVRRRAVGTNRPGPQQGHTANSDRYAPDGTGPRELTRFELSFVL